MAQALNDFILVRKTQEDTTADKKVAGGLLYAPATAHKAVSTTGEVVSCGSGRLLVDGSRAPLSVKQGDKVVFRTFVEVEVDGEVLLALHEDEIIAVL